MSEKTSEIHRLGDHVLHNSTPAPSGTDRAVCAGNPGSEARADTAEHGQELTEPAAETGSPEGEPPRVDEAIRAIRESWPSPDAVMMVMSDFEALMRGTPKAEEALRALVGLEVHVHPMMPRGNLSWRWRVNGKWMPAATPARKEPHE